MDIVVRTKALKRDIIPCKILKIIKPVYYFIRGLLYTGNKYNCIICKKTFSKFLKYDKRKNAMCPGCASLERHRLLCLYLQNETNLLNKKNKILHFAPEYSLQKKFKKLSDKNYLSTDIEHPDAMLHADITKLPIKDNLFDLILCNHVLQEIPDDKKAIREIFRILKKGGVVIITIPENNNNKTFENQGEKTDKDRAKLYGYYGALRIYGKDFVKKLTNEGFKVEIIDYIKKFKKEEIKRYGLIPELFYLCKK